MAHPIDPIDGEGVHFERFEFFEDRPHDELFM